MSSETAIRVTGLGKCFHIYDKPRDRLLQMLMRGRKRYFREFWALQDINFEVKRGESIGIVGRNGSGKSTLLQLICGTLTPTTGSIETFGRIAALLELGSGFNPEFTGRENVYLNASVLGLTPAEIDERFDSIAAFADIGSFLEQPVKTYSSGMAVRLAFAVQAQVNPDILIVDEALAVGDARFQAKCFERLRQLKENGTSILLVTHSGEQVVTHCTRAILLDAHRIQELGAPRTVVNRYMDLLFGRDRTKPTSGGDTTDSQNTDNIDTAAPVNPPSELNFDEDVYATRPLYNAHEYRWGDGAAHITDFSLTSNGRPITHPVKSGTPIQLDIAIRFYGTVVAPILGFTLKTKEGVTVAGSNTDISGENNFRELGEQGTIAHVRLRFTLRLTGGDYFISLGIASHQSEHLVPHDRRYDSIHLMVEPTEKFYGLTDLSVELATNPE